MRIGDFNPLKETLDLKGRYFNHFYERDFWIVYFILRWHLILKVLHNNIEKLLFLTIFCMVHVFQVKRFQMFLFGKRVFGNSLIILNFGNFTTFR